VFDFNGDGQVEIAYRDEDYIWVYHTLSDGTVVRSMPIRCSSRSHTEYPIVVDVDADGSAELCVTCSTTNTTNGRNLGMWDEAEVRVYESANQPWVPARSVANQHAYFVTNVNDNLTIPREQQLHHLLYAINSSCNQGGTSRPLNSFMNQVTSLNASGCVSNLAPDLAAVSVSPTQAIRYTPFTCVSDSIQVTFKYMNRGDISIGSNTTLQVSFYDGDPESQTSLATRLDTKSFQVSGMLPGDTITTTTTIRNPGGEFDLYVVLNDHGTTIPLNFGAQPWRIKECDSGNIISARLTPVSVTLGLELVQNNLTCVTAPGIPNIPGSGAVKAYALDADRMDISTDYNFYWSNGATPKPLASVDYVGQSYVGLQTGEYTVYAMHKSLTCASDTATIVVTEISASVDAQIILGQGLTANTYPTGKLHVVVNDVDGDGVGDPAGNFRFVWYDGEIFVGNTLGIGHSLSMLDAGDYSVLVTDKVTGCADSARFTIAPLPYGCPTRKSADFVAGAIEYTPFICTDEIINISFQYSNQGTDDAFGNLRISFYHGDPSQPSSQAVFIETKTIFTSGFRPGDTRTATFSIKNPGGEFELFAVLNDDGSTIPLDLVNQWGYLTECTQNNIAHIHIEPGTVKVVPELVNDNLVCSTAPGVPGRSANGVARAFVSDGNTMDSTNYDFYWSNGSAVNSNGSDYVGQAYHGLASGAYTVYAVHKTLHCASDTATVMVNEITGSVDARIIQVNDFDNANQPNGELKVLVNDIDRDGVGDPESNFQYAWYAGPEVFVGQALGTSYTLSGLGAGTYSVLVSDPSNGCYDSAFATIVQKEIILGAEESDLTGISLYPNPGTEDFAIIVDNGYVGAVQVQLLSMAGTEVTKVIGHKDARSLKVAVDTRSFKSGVYLVKISLGKEALIKKWTKL
jgi:hypothetical protein